LGGAVEGVAGGQMWLAENNPYSGGYFTFSAERDPRTTWWSTALLNYDAVFHADFKEVPEPGTLTLLGIGLIALTLGQRRRLRGTVVRSV
jgi:hypothetical protein